MNANDTENLFAFNRPSKRVELNNAFLEIDTQLTRTAWGLDCAHRTDQAHRVEDARLMIAAARALIEGDANETKRLLDNLMLSQTTRNANETNEFATYSEMVADVGDGTDEDTWNANETKSGEPCACAQLLDGHLSTCLNR